MALPVKGPQWYLIHCKPREDERALENLVRQGYECYRPVSRIERLQHGRKIILLESLFPRYLFIHLDSLENNWYPIRSTRGVSEIVRFNNKPAPVRDEIVERIRRRPASLPKVEPYLKRGERAEVNHGAFIAVDAIFLASEGGERVVVLLNMMQKDQQVVFPLQAVRKVG